MEGEWDLVCLALNLKRMWAPTHLLSRWGSEFQTELGLNECPKRSFVELEETS